MQNVDLMQNCGTVNVTYTWRIQHVDVSVNVTNATYIQNANVVHNITQKITLYTCTNVTYKLALT